VFLLMDESKIVWFSERGGNKLGRFDPQTEAFKEFELPGPAASQFKRRFLLGGQKIIAAESVASQASTAATERMLPNITG
jgi:streptogramin lyase